MGRVWSISPAIRQLAQDAFDDVIDELGKDCALFMASKMIPCINCVFDPIGNKSANVYLSGGPIPFQSICPMCNGAGYKNEADDPFVIKMVLYWKPVEYRDVDLDTVNINDGMLYAKCFASEINKIQKCEYMIAEYDLDNRIRYKYQLASEPVDVHHITQGRYLLSKWKRLG